jgi:type I restriction enzyme S subunit
MPRSDWSEVSEIEFPVPALGEQEEIGRVLAEMDAEIEALEARLEKARQVKQGMMQELLTGRVRLV